jgi:ectoine hydroxylase-related dioxygenase (phytanoyl-CoA dioxygenase family)
MAMCLPGKQHQTFVASRENHCREGNRAALHDHLERLVTRKRNRFCGKEQPAYDSRTLTDEENTPPMKKTCREEHMPLKSFISENTNATLIQKHILQQKRALALQNSLLMARMNAQKLYVGVSKKYQLHQTTSCSGCSRMSCAHCLLKYPQNLRSSVAAKEMKERRKGCVQRKLVVIEQAKGLDDLISRFDSGNKKRKQKIPLRTIDES